MIIVIRLLFVIVLYIKLPWSIILSVSRFPYFSAVTLFSLTNLQWRDVKAMTQRIMVVEEQVVWVRAVSLRKLCFLSELAILAVPPPHVWPLRAPGSVFNENKSTFFIGSSILLSPSLSCPLKRWITLLYWVNEATKTYRLKK